MKQIVLPISLFISTLAFSQKINIIPRPVKTTAQNGSFSLTKSTVLLISSEAAANSVNFLNDYLQKFYGFQLKPVKKAAKNYIRLSTKKLTPVHEVQYEMQITPEFIDIIGNNDQGTFYGVQTLIQLLPFPPATTLKIPAFKIQDYPRFAYRGMHLDVGRHFMPVDFIKKYIDYIAMHKMNYFHWHLTEDQGWRIEIKKYPRLTEVGAYRNGTIIGRYPGKGNDNIRYGGFYTQDEIREVVNYASKRYVTIVPEIEMPGHSSAAIAAYPWLSCFANEKTVIPDNMISEASKQATGKLVQETWGVFDDVFCAGNDSTFNFLQDVIDEVVQLFPGKYIHVGGDECPKTNWKRCPKCQKRILDNHLKDEHELQSYLIQRMEKYINGKGKTLIGWDEILEGGLAPKAIVMSWRGEQGGIDAANQDHKVVMTPGNYVYFDHSQSKNEDSVTIGGYTSVEVVYNYQPVPKQLPVDKAKYVLGSQGNVWTEYMGSPEKVEYMIFPRLSALSEVVWSPKSDSGYKDFETRLPSQFKRYELWGANYSKAYYDLKASITPSEDFNGVLWNINSNVKLGNINYYDAGSGNIGSGISYTNPLKVTSSQTLAAFRTVNGKATGDVISQKFSFNKATGKKISLKTSPTPETSGNGGAFALVNGARSEKGINSPDWLGWRGTDMEAVIDLGKTESVSAVTVHALSRGGSRLYVPAFIQVSGSTDGNNFVLLGTNNEFVQDESGLEGNITVHFDPANIRFVKVVAKNYDKIPKGKRGEGEPALMMIDEIQVD